MYVLLETENTGTKLQNGIYRRFVTVTSIKSNFCLENVISCPGRTEENHNTKIKTNKGTDKENPHRNWAIHPIFTERTSLRRLSPSIITYSTGSFHAQIWISSKCTGKSPIPLLLGNISRKTVVGKIQNGQILKARNVSWDMSRQGIMWQIQGFQTMHFLQPRKLSVKKVAWQVQIF